MSCQFLRGLPDFLFVLLRFQFKARFDTLQASILITCTSHLSLIIIPAKARDCGITGVGLSVCLSVCYQDN